MSSSNPSAVPNPSPEKKRRYLSAEKKFQIYLEAQDGGKPVGELLHREGLFSTYLARIRRQVKEGALQRLGAKPGRQQGQLLTSMSYIEQFEQELLGKATPTTVARKRAVQRCGACSHTSAKKPSTRKFQAF